MTFANPKMLWLLLVLPPALLAFFWWSGRVRQNLLTQFIQARLLPTLTIGISTTRQKIRLGCLVLAVACLILALARPQWGFDWQEVKQRGLDIVVAIDTSKSMLAEDIAPNRLARAKLAALDLMQRARADRLGLVAFAGSAFLQCPLTIDDSAFRQSVEALDVNIIPQGGTAIAEAITTALTAYKEGDNYKVLVLFTDGEDHDSGAVEAAEKAAKEGLRIFTIGMGTADGELLHVKDAQGKTDYVRDEQGNVVKSHLNERLLQQIAGATEGGFYLPLRGAKVIDTLYDEGLAKLPKTQHQEKFVRQYHERYHWPLAVAIVLLLVEMLFPERKRERPAKHVKHTKEETGGELKLAAGAALASHSSPAAEQPAPRSSIPPAQSSLVSLSLVACALGCLLPSQGTVLASPSSALREYKAGKYEDSLKEYERLLKKSKDDPRLHFNAGAAAYKNQQFDEAAKQFNETLSAPDLKLQGLGYYNEGNALFHLGERNPDPAKRKEAWEKALQDFQSALKLSPQDPDAKHNYELVKRMLEELKQQPQQSNQDKKDQQQNQDQQQQQDQQKQDQQKQQQDQQKQQQAKQDQQKQQSAQQQKSEEQKKQEQQQAQQAEQREQQQQEQKSASQASEKPDEKEQEAAMAQAQGQMTEQQAKQLLDAEKADEKLLQPKPEGKPSDHARPFKDW
jgi:Ca-activated chloride channel homolog